MFKKIIYNKELRLVSMSQLINFLGNVLLVKLLSNFLSKESYGQYFLIMSICLLISLLPFSSFDIAVRRYIPDYKFNKDLDKKIPEVLISYCIFLAFYLIFYVFLSLIVIPYNKQDPVFRIMWFFIVFDVFKSMFINIENSKRNRLFMFLSLIFEFFCKTVILFILYKLQLLNVYSIIVSFAIVSSSIFLYGLIVNRRYLQFGRINMASVRHTLGEIVKFSYPLLVISVCGWCQNMVSRWYLRNYDNLSRVAEFSVMSSLAIYISTGITYTIGNFVAPIMYEKENYIRGFTRKMLKKLLPILSLLYVLIVIVVFILKDAIVFIITSRKYQDISWMLPYMVIITLSYSLADISTYELYVDKKTKLLMVPFICAGFVSIISGNYLIKNYHINGAFYSFLLTYMISALLLLVVSRKHYHSNLSKVSSNIY